MELGIGFTLSAFIAGLLTFLAPCTLPLVPAYLSFISGVSPEELQNPETQATAKRKILKNGLFFIIGFSIIFILFGTLAGLAGQALVPWRILLSRIGGILVILFGLFMLGILKIPALLSEKRLSLPLSRFSLGTPSSSLAIGGAFAFGWTPCVGPILGSILFLASTSSTTLQGSLLLAVFSLGLSIPFILVALAYSSASTYIARYSKFLNIISITGGIFLIILGLLLVTDNFGLTIQYGYRLFDFIHYDKLLDYL